ncbi:MAG: hypothetical protein QY323_01110 [Patescibacteria group bacterium]|nr:MAG: hypothetical protein QY323_01110 [Patescibacteria group bacterium]
MIKLAPKKKWRLYVELLLIGGMADLFVFSWFIRRSVGLPLHTSHMIGYVLAFPFDFVLSWLAKLAPGVFGSSSRFFGNRLELLLVCVAAFYGYLASLGLDALERRLKKWRASKQKPTV